MTDGLHANAAFYALQFTQAIHISEHIRIVKSFLFKSLSNLDHKLDIAPDSRNQFNGEILSQFQESNLKVPVLISLENYDFEIGHLSIE